MNPARRDVLILAAVGGAAALAGALAGALALQSTSGVAKLLSSRFPDATGRARALSEWQGKPLVCNFWATWCAPCREELPLLDRIQREFAAKSVQVVGIGIDSAANIREYLKTVPVSYPMLAAEATGIELMRELGNRGGGLPFSVALDRRGRLRNRRLGAYSEAQLREEVERLLQ